MRRGTIVSVALGGDLGKPRPALIIQSELAFDITTSFVVLPITSTLVPSPLLRVHVMPTAQNGLRHPSQIMVDKISTAPRAKVGGIIGQLEDDALSAAIRNLLTLIGAS